ncbi:MULTISPECIES: hypothetical protein [unclassified Campylobacter]|uniref:hypothetical protein n=1 Tax=unclassified Campylobacter TaxID=2593542 RepID=UPI0022E9BC54|nr:MULTISPECIES: hypothetical protein [unclassified Campylobacter]MDA3079980.1 hypothetical protein [Campylobacter sp. CS_NA2]MDA3081260.1 hypothetical protein [Campylobacter sp. CS_NA1]MDA3086434.1 hypothetical protein [Campylobacter sp. CS_ED1]MDA3091002.1 hypothetical protein [Campylobacter sp. CS_ED2]WBR51900.1 hypothetical protein PF026_03400 [Campylobacter sp. CS_NA3]
MYSPLSSLMEFDTKLLKATIGDLRRDFKLCVSESEAIGDETHCYGNFAEVVGFMHWHMLAPYGAAIYHGVSEKYNDDVFNTENIQKYDLTEALAVFGKVLYTERYHGNLTYSLCEDGIMAELLDQLYKELVKFQSKPINKIKKVIADFEWFLRKKWGHWKYRIKKYLRKNNA